MGSERDRFSSLGWAFFHGQIKLGGSVFLRCCSKINPCEIVKPFIYIYTHTYTYMLYTYTHVNMSWVYELGILLPVIFFKCRVGTVPCRAFPKIRWLLWVGQTHGTHWTAIITCTMIAGYVSFAVSFPRHSQQVNKKVFLLWISVSGFVETSIKRRCFPFP